MSFQEQTRWTEELQAYWRRFSDFAFTLRQPDEELTLNLSGENTLYLRLNASLVRQNTLVNQRVLELVFQKNGRRVSLQLDLSGDEKADFAFLRRLFEQARVECASQPADPFALPFANNGRSEQNFAGDYPAPEEIFRALTEETKGSEFTGLLALGPVVRANRNHLGQDHWFSSHQFFMDYSLFTVNVDGENKAVKANYSGRRWDTREFVTGFRRAHARLQLLKKANRSLKPGDYRAYLAPGAFCALTDMLSWAGLSLGAYQRGNSAFAKMYEGKAKLSPKFSVRENFELGLAPAFNKLGEVAPLTLPLVENGELKNMLVSTRTASEVGKPSNFADINEWGHEYLRSPEIATGTLAEEDVLRRLGTGVYLSQLHYCNWSNVQNARITGMTRYACFWVENGEIVSPIKDLRFDDSLYRIMGASLEELTTEAVIDPVISTYWQRAIGGTKLPGVLLSEFQFVL